MVKFIVVACGVGAVFYAWTRNPVYLVPLLSGVAFLVACAVETHLRTSGRWTDADYHREVNGCWFLMGTIGLGVVALVVAAASFSADGWTTDCFIYGGFSLVFFGRWVYRKARGQTPTPGRAAESGSAADRLRE